MEKKRSELGPEHDKRKEIAARAGGLNACQCLHTSGICIFQNLLTKPLLKSGCHQKL